MPSIRGVLGFVTLISIMDVLRTFDQLIPLAPQAVEIGNESIMLYIYNIAFRDGSENARAGQRGQRADDPVDLDHAVPRSSVTRSRRRGPHDHPTTPADGPDAPQGRRSQPTGAAAPRRRRRRRGFWMLAGLFLAVTCLVMLSPFIWTAMSVTKPTDVAFANPPVFFYQPTLQAFVDLWQTTYFYQYLVNTLIVAVITTVVALVIGTARRVRAVAVPGLHLGRAAGAGAGLPGAAAVRRGAADVRDQRALGIYDTTYALAIALVAINQPFTIWLLRNFFAEIPKELDEAAMIDGCTRISMLRKVMIPLMGPGILTAGIFVFLFAFQEYLTAAILTDIAARPCRCSSPPSSGRRCRMLQQAGAAADAADPAGDRHRLHRPEVPGGRAGLGRGQGLTRRSADEPLVLLPGMNCSAGLWSEPTSAASTALTPRADRAEPRRVRSTGCSTSCRRGSRSPGCPSAGSWPWRWSAALRSGWPGCACCRPTRRDRPTGSRLAMAGRQRAALAAG